jgi:hypothetical protein
MAQALNKCATACCAGFCCMAAAPALGQAVTPESLQGSTIVATVNYEMQRRRDGQDVPGSASVTYRLNIGAGGAFTGSLTRTSGANTSTRQFSGTLGRPYSPGSGGHAVWILSGNTLRLLRTYEIGGKNTTITFGPAGRSCTVRSPFMRETGAGSAIRRDSIRGGTVEITSAKQTSSSCQVTR